MKTGILGGTFNPIHLAHLRIAEEVHRVCKLDRTLFIPAAEPPHKEIAGEVSFAHRLAMVDLAIKDFPGFQSSDMELHRQGKSFSVDTLELLKQEEPDGERYFIIGLDSYRDIASWKDFRQIFDLCHLVITSRPGVSIDNPLSPLPVADHNDFCYDEKSGTMRHKSGNRLIFSNETDLDISSTEIREKLAAGLPVQGLISPDVANYIKEHGLYSLPDERRSY